MPTNKVELPPHNTQAEDALIAMTFHFPEQFEKIISSVDANHFYNLRNKNIYTKAIEFYFEYGELDITSFKEYVEYEYYEHTAECMRSHSYSIFKIESIIKKVLEWHNKRISWELGNYLKEKTQEKGSFEIILSKIYSVIDNIENIGNSNLISLDELITKNCNKEHYEELSSSYLKTGWHLFDSQIIFKNTDFILLAGRPSMGKTAFALALALRFSLNEYTVGIISLEMRSEYLLKRMALNAAYHSGKKGYEEYEHGCKKLIGHRIYFDDCPQPSLTLLKNRVKMMVRRGVNVIIIDYLTLLQGEGENQNVRVSNISQTLKNSARHFKIPFIVVSQLNRDVEKRKDKKPCIADLRDSGGLEQDADIIMFAYRPFKCGVEIDNMQNTEKLFRLILSKQRDGQVGEYDFFYDDAKHYFAPWDKSIVTSELF